MSSQVRTFDILQDLAAGAGELGASDEQRVQLQADVIGM